MSDSYLRPVPTDPAWVPSASAARRAITVLSPLVPEAEDAVGLGHPIKLVMARY